MRTVLLGERYRDVLELPLKARGFLPYWLPEHPGLDQRLAGHADLMVFQSDDQLIVARHLAEDIHFVNFLTSASTQYQCAEEQKPVYPGDASLCACRLGRYLIHNPRVTNPSILENLNKTLISVRQGYARCMVCAVGADAIITSDHGIAKAVKNVGIQMLEITQGYITLEGFPYGFIGGSSFQYGRTVYFTGTLNAHPDCERILTFISEQGYSADFLTNLPIFDIGSVIAI